MKKTTLLIFFIQSVLVLFATVAGYCDTYYVNKKGSGNTKTIQSAIKLAKEGDRIIVEAGRYWEDILINRKNNLTIEALQDFNAKNIELRGVRGRWGMIKIIHSDGVTLKGFRVTATNYSPSNIFYISSSRVTILNNTIERAKNAGIYACCKSVVDIIGNRISANRIGVMCSNSEVEARYNIFALNSLYGFRVKRLSKLDAEHNVFYKNTKAGVLISHGAVASLYNNIFVRNAIGLKGPQEVSENYNLYYMNKKAVKGLKKGNHDLFEDPLFVDPLHYDFRLRKDSPAIGKGSDGLDLGAWITN